MLKGTFRNTSAAALVIRLGKKQTLTSFQTTALYSGHLEFHIKYISHRGSYNPPTNAVRHGYF